MNQKKNMFFIVWTPKSGSTSLYTYLSQHPQIYMSPIKETNFFATDIDFSQLSEQTKKVNDIDMKKYMSKRPLKLLHMAFVRNKINYESLFWDAWEGQICWEASTSYFRSEEAAHNIKNSYPDAKIIILLRNPILRAYSHRMMSLRWWFAKWDDFIGDFVAEKEFWRNRRWRDDMYYNLWLYSQKLRQYISIFWNQNVRIYLNTDLKDKKKFIDILKFLGCNTDIYDYSALKKEHNVWNIPRNSLFITIKNKVMWLGVYKKYIKWNIPVSIQQFFAKLLYEKAAPQITLESYQKILKLYIKDINATQEVLNRDLSDWLIFNYHSPKWSK